MTIAEHINQPVCGTLCGLRLHLRLIPLDELHRFCWETKSGTVNELCEKLWDMRRNLKHKIGADNCVIS
jgi:hypothetical protein